MISTSIGRAIFIGRIAKRLEVDVKALRLDIGMRQLAPLDPDRFLAWTWQRGDRAKGTQALTVDDVAFELGEGFTRDEVRRQYVHLAALVRRNQRLGLEPFEGVR